MRIKFNEHISIEITLDDAYEWLCNFGTKVCFFGCFCESFLINYGYKII